MPLTDPATGEPMYGTHDEIRMLRAENERLRATLAQSCEDERSQMWEATGGGGCSRAISAEVENERLRAALQELADDDGPHSVGYYQRLAREALSG
jgi:hypothetical protein